VPAGHAVTHAGQQASSSLLQARGAALAARRAVCVRVSTPRCAQLRLCSQPSPLAVACYCCQSSATFVVPECLEPVRC
jgi:hypothetical protein